MSPPKLIKHYCVLLLLNQSSDYRPVAFIICHMSLVQFLRVVVTGALALYIHESLSGWEEHTGQEPVLCTHFLLILSLKTSN